MFLLPPPTYFLGGGDPKKPEKVVPAKGLWGEREVEEDATNIQKGRKGSI